MPSSRDYSQTKARMTEDNNHAKARARETHITSKAALGRLDNIDPQ